MSISILGEAIVDLLPNQPMNYTAVVGGSPFNFARAISKTGTQTFYLSPISIDAFGDLIVQSAQENNIGLNGKNRTPAPTSIAIVTYVDAQPSYALYREGIADLMFTEASLQKFLPKSTKVLHTGSLMLVPEIIDTVKQFIVYAKAQGIWISLDLNLRPNVKNDTQQYVKKILDLIPYADVVKASDEDLAFLGLNVTDISTLMKQYFNHAILVYTMGSLGANAYFGDIQVSAKAMQVTEFVDSVGAGDTFFGYFMGTLLSESLNKYEWFDKKLLKTALERASTAAAMNVEKKGCQPPEIMTVIEKLQTF